MPTEILADERGLRAVRRRRAFDAMEASDIDVLLLGREANARYVAGAQRLWTAGTRPFGPGCVVVRATGAIHLVSTWDEGVPDDIPHDHLFGITWNPGNLLRWLQGIDGLADARRIGTDSLTPRFARLLPKLFPSAELVDAEPALETARMVKAPEEVAAIRTSISVAETALAAAVAELRPGVTEGHLTGVFMEAMARQGVTTPATQRVARIASAWRPRARSEPRPERSEPRPVQGDDLVVFDAGVVAGGYGAELGRTWPAGGEGVDAPTRDLYRRADDLWSRLLDACRPGASCHGLLAAYEAGGDEPPRFAVGTGLGLGFDLPVVTGDLPETAAHARFEPGMVLAVTACVWAEHTPAVLRKEAVVITEEGPEVLTSSPHWRP
jgi:Xaa-Pro dipeptidase